MQIPMLFMLFDLIFLLLVFRKFLKHKRHSALKMDSNVCDSFSDPL